MLRLLLALALAMPGTALAEAVVAARTLRAGTVLAPEDLRLEATADGALRDIDTLVGMQLRAMVSEGRPLDPAQLSSPTLIQRNQLVTLTYERSALRIETEGRALGSGAVGEMIRVMNNTSRTTVTGRIAPDGTVIVAQN